MFSALLALFCAGCGDDKTNVTDIALSKSTLRLEVGQEERLHATLKPDNAANKGIQWKSDNEKVAKVDADGLVRAVSTGKTVIYAISKDGEKTASCTVAVVIPVEGISLERCPGTITLGSQEQLWAKVEPAEASNQALTWISTNPTVATVDENGRVSALAAGETLIIASSQETVSKTKSCRMEVTTPVSGVSIDGCLPGEALTPWPSRQLTAVIEPSDATNQAVRWTSSNPSAATVSDSGLVTVNMSGTGRTTTLQVSTEDGGWTDTCEVVVHIPVSGVSVGGCSATAIDPGQTRQLSATFSPFNATNQNVTWESLDAQIATVDRTTGRVSAPNNSPGESARIRVRTADGGKEAMCNVPVNIRVTSLSLSCPPPLNAGDNGWSSPGIQPANATNKNLRWESLHPSIASLNGARLTGHLAGTATIRATTTDGSNISATCDAPVWHVISSMSHYSSCEAWRGLKIFGRGFHNVTSVTLADADNSRIDYRVDSPTQITLTGFHYKRWSNSPIVIVAGGITVRSPFVFQARFEDC